MPLQASPAVEKPSRGWRKLRPNALRRHQPDLCQPDLCQPDLCQPDLCQPDLCQPDLCQPDL
jgi:Keratin, high sulfur B2 protein